MKVPIALLGLLLVGLACAHGGGDASAQTPGTKLDPGLRRLLARPAPRDSVVGVFIRLAGAAGASEREALEQAGARIGTVSGKLLTARLALRQVPAVAALEFVRYIEISRRLNPTHPRPGRSDSTAADGNP